jgi:integrase
METNLIGKIRELRPGHFQYYFRFEHKNYYLQKSLDNKSLKKIQDAQLLQFYISNQIETGTFDPNNFDTKHYSFEKQADKWIKDSVSLSPDWLYVRKRTTEHMFKPFFKNRDVRKITKSDIEDFQKHLIERKLSPKYMKNLMGELRIFFESLDIPKLKFPKDIPVSDSVHRWLNEKQQDEVFEFLPKDDIFTFLRYTGSRPNEARGLLWSAIDFEKKIISFETVLTGKNEIRNRTKTGKIRILPIIPEIEGCFSSEKRVGHFVFMNGKKPFSSSVLQGQWKRANQLAHEKFGTPILGVYAGTKHSFGTQRLAQGFDLGSIGQIMGHEDLKSTKRYAKYLPQNLSNVMSGTSNNIHKVFSLNIKGLDSEIKVPP